MQMAPGRGSATAGTFTEGQGEVRVCRRRERQRCRMARQITHKKSLLRTIIAVALLGQLKLSSFWPQSAPTHLGRHSDNAKSRTQDKVTLLTLRPSDGSVSADGRESKSVRQTDRRRPRPSCDMNCKQGLGCAGSRGCEKAEHRDSGVFVEALSGACP